MTPTLDGAGLGEEGHQRGDDEDRFEALAQHEHERLHQEIGAGAAIGHEPLRALQAGQQPGVNRVQLVGVRAGGGAGA